MPPAPPYPRGSGANGDRFRLPLVDNAVHLPRGPSHLSKRLFPTCLLPLRRRSAHFAGWPASRQSACYDWFEGLSIILSRQDLVGCCPNLPSEAPPHAWCTASWAPGCTVIGLETYLSSKWAEPGEQPSPSFAGSTLDSSRLLVVPAPQDYDWSEACPSS